MRAKSVAVTVDRDYDRSVQEPVEHCCSDGEVFKPIETASLKTIAAFWNSRDGGMLPIGVVDDGRVTGIDSDLASFHKAGKDDRDRFLLHLGNVISQSMGEAAAAEVTSQILSVDGHDLCRVHMRPSAVPVEATVIVDRKGQMEKEVGFYVRVGNGRKKLDEIQKQKYVKGRWGSG